MTTLFPETITTDRLRLERLSLDTVDLGAYYECCSAHEPEIETVTNYLPWTPHASIHETKTVIENYERQWDEGTRAEYVIRPRSEEPAAGTIAGSAGLLCRWEQDLALPAIWLRKRFLGVWILWRTCGRTPRTRVRTARFRDGRNSPPPGERSIVRGRRTVRRAPRWPVRGTSSTPRRPIRRAG